MEAALYEPPFPINIPRRFLCLPFDLLLDLSPAIRTYFSPDGVRLPHLVGPTCIFVSFLPILLESDPFFAVFFRLTPPSCFLSLLNPFDIGPRRMAPA